MPEPYGYFNNTTSITLQFFIPLASFEALTFFILHVYLIACTLQTVVYPHNVWKCLSGGAAFYARCYVTHLSYKCISSVMGNVVYLLSRQCGLLLVPVDVALKHKVDIKQVSNAH